MNNNKNSDGYRRVAGRADNREVRLVRRPVLPVVRGSCEEVDNIQRAVGVHQTGVRGRNTFPQLENVRRFRLQGGAQRHQGPRHGLQVFCC